MKENNDLNRLFREADRFMEVDKEKRERTLERLHSAYEEINERTHVTAGYAETVLRQLRYMDKGIWIADAAVNILFILILLLLRYYGAGEQDIMMTVMLLASAAGGVSIWILTGLFSNGAGELTETCYFNAKQLAGLEMAILGGSNLILLAFAVFYVGIQWKMSLFRIGVYVGVPFLFTVSVCMGCMMAETRRRRSVLTAGAGVLSAVLVLAAAAVPQVYLPSAAAVWGMALAAGAAVLAAQIRRLFHEIGRGEILCTE